jgi:hypothetical protein
MLGDGRQNVNRQLVRVRVIDGDKLHARVHERRDECQIAGETIELGDHEPGAMLSASLKSLHQLGPIVTLAGLDLDVLGDKLPRATVKVVAHGRLLRPSPLLPWRSVETR